ncbi:MAG: hypothetical protein D6693_08110 [Planctomycetota bacterium]|nr:MAG: hypothetical protein D6693_08110 [Planctomycetota bacterium]
MANTGWRQAAALLAALLAGADLSAQTEDLRPVDESIEDVSPLRTSLFDQRLDPGPAAGFERVYTSDALPGRFARISGALWAVFPRSAYVPTERGLAAIVPENTVFYLGGPPAEAATPADPVGVSPNRVSARVSAFTGGEALSARARPSDRLSRPSLDAAGAGRATVWSSPLYRRARLRALLSRAASG